MTIETAFKEAIYNSLQGFLYSNAVFLAERLYAACANPENLHLLGTCYYRSGLPKRAIGLLKDNIRTEATRYLLAVCYYEIGQFAEAETALLADARLGEPGDVPNGAQGLHLLGMIARYTRYTIWLCCLTLRSKGGRTARAIQYFRKALELDPFLWTSFEELCDLGT